MKLLENFDFTQSNLQDYVDCPYRFYLRYILHTKWPALVVDDALDFELRGQSGARFHRLVQQYLLGVPEERLSALADADPNPDIAQWWDHFLTAIPPLLEGDRFVEMILSADLAGQRLLAKYDLILVKAGGQLVIYDWKTSQKRIRKEWLLERIQTRLYRFLLVHSGKTLTGCEITSPAQIEMNYWFAPLAHPETPVNLAYDQTAYEKDEKYLTSLIEEILDREAETFFRTSDLNKCRFCVYRSHCDRGTEAGDLAAFEDFEMEPENFTVELDFDQIEEIQF
jgi:RecB family exonuclease